MNIDMMTSGIFWAFSQQDIEAIKDEPNLIVEFTDKCAEDKECNIGDAWELFDVMFKDVIFNYATGIRSEDFSDDLSHFLSVWLFTSDEVKKAKASLSGWTHEKILKELQKFSTKDVHNLQSFTTDTGKELLLKQFDKVVGFFRKATEQDLGVVFTVEQ